MCLPQLLLKGGLRKALLSGQRASVDGTFQCSSMTVVWFKTSTFLQRDSGNSLQSLTPKLETDTLLNRRAALHLKSEKHTLTAFHDVRI